VWTADSERQASSLVCDTSYNYLVSQTTSWVLSSVRVPRRVLAPPPPEVIPDITKIFNKILGGAPYTHSPYRWCGRWAEAHPHQLPNAKYIDSCKRTPKGVVRTNLVDASTSMPRSPWTMGGSCTSLARSRSKEILAGNFGWGKIGPLQFAGAGLID
jgi:hypothetical protein